MAGIRYYPLSRVQTGLTTTGNLFTLNGVPYRGPYYLTYDGKAFTGPNPSAGGNELLEPISENSTKPASRRLGPAGKQSKAAQFANNFEKSFTSRPTGTASLKQLVPYYPVPLESDYQRGYFTRYFAKKVNMKGYILEISYEDWAKTSNNTDPTFEDYEVLDMFWQLTGPKDDVRISQYEIKGGVSSTNKRVTESKARNFPGLVEFIGGDYTKFARLTT